MASWVNSGIKRGLGNKGKPATREEFRLRELLDEEKMHAEAWYWRMSGEVEWQDQSPAQFLGVFAMIEEEIAECQHLLGSNRRG